MLVWLVGPLLTMGLAVSPPELQRAEDLAAQFKYAEARAALVKARALKNLDRQSLLRILELQGITAGQLRQSGPAEAAFRELLVLDPGHKLDADYAPRVATPFLEAGGWVTTNGSLEVKADAGQGGGKLVSVSVEVVKDPLKQARAVRFHLLGAAARDETVSLQAGRAQLPALAAELSWWAELLGANDAQLVLVGSAAQPRIDKVDAPVAVAPPPPPLVTEPPPAVSVSASSSGLRTASYFVVGGAVVAAAVGGYFGLQSANAFGQVQKAARDASGHITGLTEKQAWAFNATGAQDATIANALFVTAGALGIGGVVMWVLGAPVTVTPAPAGVFVSGRFP